MRADDLPGVIDEAIAVAPSGTAVFIVHGMGTGRLKAEVHSLLKRSRQVYVSKDRCKPSLHPHDSSSVMSSSLLKLHGTAFHELVSLKSTVLPEEVCTCVQVMHF